MCEVILGHYKSEVIEYCLKYFFLVSAPSSHSWLYIENNVISPADYYYYYYICFSGNTFVARFLPYYGRKEASFVF